MMTGMAYIIGFIHRSCFSAFGFVRSQWTCFSFGTGASLAASVGGVQAAITSGDQRFSLGDAQKAASNHELPNPIMPYSE